MTEAARRALSSIAAEAGWSADPARVEIAPTAAAIAHDLPVSDVAAGAYGALALAAADLHALRGGAAPGPMVDRRRAGLAMTGNSFLTVDDVAPATWDPLTGYYRCGDSRHVYLHANFPHHRDGLLTLLGADDGDDRAADRDAVAARLTGWNAAALEEAAQARGLCAMMLRSRASWEAHGQFAALRARPLVERRLWGDGRKPLPPAGPRPLSGLRVLDLTRVIAGPMAGRALAELGAEVLRVSGPGLPFIEPLVIDTGFAKRAAHVDLNAPAGRETLSALVRGADVLIDGYRPGALAAKGFGEADLAALNPTLTYVTLSAFSDHGPWAGRRGYDSYVQAAVGLTAPERPGDEPARLPCQPLDYLTGCLAAFGAVLGLMAREKTGGGAAELSLARTAIWLWEMADALGPEPAPPARNPTGPEVAAEGALREMQSAFGRVASLGPPYGFREFDAEWPAPPRPLGSDDAGWL